MTTPTKPADWPCEGPKDAWKVSYLEEALGRLYAIDRYLIAPGREGGASARHCTCISSDVLREEGFLEQFPAVRVNAEFQNEGEGDERKRNPGG